MMKPTCGLLCTVVLTGGLTLHQAQAADSEKAGAETQITYDVSPRTEEPKDVAGAPSYVETVEWLQGHSEATGLWVLPMTMKASTRVFESKWPCVILAVTNSRTLVPGKSDTWVSTQLIALSEANIATIRARRGRGNYACVDIKGRVGLSIPVESKSDTVMVEGVRAASTHLCFNSIDNATRAAKALIHIAELCGATSTAEPF